MQAPMIVPAVVRARAVQTVLRRLQRGIHTSSGLAIAARNRVPAWLVRATVAELVRSGQVRRMQTRHAGFGGGRATVWYGLPDDPGWPDVGPKRGDA